MQKDVRSQDTVFVINSVAASRVGRDLAWEFLKTNWPTFKQRYENSFLLPRVVKSVTEHFASADRAKEVTEFFTANKTLSVERSVQQSIENIHLNIDLLRRDLKSIEAFFK